MRAHPKLSVWLCAVVFATNFAAVPVEAQRGRGAGFSDRSPRRLPPRRPALLASPRHGARGPAVVTLGPIDLGLIRNEDSQVDGLPGVPVRIGVNRMLPPGPIGPDTHGTWETAPDGTEVWSIQIEAPDAEGLRLHFAALDLPDDAQVVVAGVDGLAAEYTTSRVRLEGGFWAAATAGPVSYVEYQRPASSEDRPPILVIDEVSHLYRGLTASPVPVGGGESAVVASSLLPCEEDVSCWPVDANARDAVGRLAYVISGLGSFVCSGALLNDNDPNTYAGYLLTAYHCINSPASADSLTAYWLYQSGTCNGSPPPLFSLPQSHGASLVATSHTSGGSDSSLLRLYDDPSDGQGFTSWTTVSPASSVDVFGIHHPGGTHKRYSEGFITTQAPVCSGQPTSRFHYNDWAVGITEGGSSGSPLFNNRWQLVGQLYGACYFSPPACDNPEQYNTVYGKFSYFYPLISSYLNTITPDDPYEDNDTLDQAAILEPGLRDLILVDFDDYFAVVVDGPAELIATAAFSTSQINLNLRLLTDAGEVLDSSDGASGAEQVGAAIEPGVYVVHAWRTGMGQGARYQLGVQLIVEGIPEAPTADPAGVFKNRYLAVVPGNAGVNTALRVTFNSVQVPDPPNVAGNPPPDLSALNGLSMWAGPPVSFTELESPLVASYASRLQCEPYYMDWSTLDLVNLYGPEIAPSSSYSVQALFEGDNPAGPDNYSAPLLVETARWGDVTAPYQLPSPEVLSQPNVQDILAVVDTVKDLPTSQPRTRVQLHPAVVSPMADVSILQISRVIDAVLGKAYPYSGVPACPQ